MFSEVGAVWCSPFRSLRQHVHILQERKWNEREATTFTEPPHPTFFTTATLLPEFNLNASHINS